MSRIMRVLIFFDLPTKTVIEKKEYTLFRKFLLQSGYDMLQYSVYAKITRNRDDAQRMITRVKQNLPPKGQVRALLVTEKQYTSMQILLGKPTVAEQEVKCKELLVL